MFWPEISKTPTSVTLFTDSNKKDDFVVLLQCTTRKNGFINEEFEKKIVNVGIILFSQKRRPGIISMDNLFLKII